MYSDINNFDSGGPYMARIKTFDWSILDRNSLVNMLWQIYPEIVDKKLTPAKFHLILSKYIKKFLPIRISKKFDETVEFGWVYIGGTYYADWDQENKKSIEILLVYNPFEKYVTVNRSKFKRMCRTFADVVLHEIIHMRQYRRRNFKILPDYESTAQLNELRKEQSYLGCTDEIDAYSFNIACELMDRFKNNKKEVIQYIGKKHRRGPLLSHSLRSYLRAFEYNHNHPIIKRLKTRIIRYLPNAELGKPYKTVDWINC